MMTPPPADRVRTLTKGTALIVTDLHGDGAAFRRCRDYFLAGQARGELDYFICCGDLIHRESPPEEDDSLAMLLEMQAWQASDPEHVIYLLGNHELSHIYRIILRKGDYRYTPRLAAAMGAKRAELLDYLATLPFYVRTAAGVAIAHAGAGSAMLEADNWHTLRWLDHEAVWAGLAARYPPETCNQIRAQISDLKRVSYDELVREAWNVQSPADPFYDDWILNQLFMMEPLFDLLWNSFFLKNEQDFGSEYEQMVTAFLALLSEGFQPQRLLVCGHIAVADGVERVYRNQLRLATAAHAKPRSSGKMLRLRLDRPVNSLDELEQNLISLF
ncbi:MAG: metallophosphoesterase [Ardenticatenales bacterium]|nr:metallophosphoesterase [Ardenticatenales bacterium]